ncbi:RiPP maturation radical SAM C-methyltransferase [Paraburkholderia sp. EG285A]|uniref:RiPP maturation radical SAM C-methyltransferase n=1 Tax=Paraburkholderia sp. EG285A TaxID=3237009 RepID=UPI0034D32633
MISRSVSGTDNASRSMDLVLVNMPYAGIERPSLSIGLLHRILTDAGFDVRSEYANLHFAEQIGIQAYQFIDITRSEDVVGEWTFRQAAFPDYQPDDHAYLVQLLKRLIMSPETRERLGLDGLRRMLCGMRDAANSFIVQTADRILRMRPRIVGCSSTFQQHLASLALLRRIKETSPTTITMMGGANCETVMGRTTHLNFHWVDYVVSGEADGIIANVVGRILRAKPGTVPTLLPHTVLTPRHRTLGYPLDAASNDGMPRQSSASIEHLPAPTFSDYFDVLRASRLAAAIDPGLPVETSRGCWWGQKKHCTFCGLNGGGMAYRSRSAQGVVTQLDELSASYGIRKFEVVDNILDMRHFDTLLPQLQSRGLRLFYETKSNLRREHVAALVAAGVTWIQPGIESLHSNVLTLMDKGAQAWMNVQLLKWAREFGLRLSWSMLFGFPGEDDADYHMMADMVPKICHLQPPGGMIHIRYDRYSPYHSKARNYGLDLVPARLLKYVYPLSDADLMEQTYFFEERGAADLGRNLSVGRKLERPGADALRTALAQWSKTFWSSMPAVLCEEPGGSGLQLLDTRPIAAERQLELDGAAAAILRFCDSARSVETLPDRLRTDGLFYGSDEQVADALAFLLRRAYAIELDGRVLSLTLKGDLPVLPDGSEFPGGFVWRSEYSASKIAETPEPVVEE